jgi:hypothetical protein
MRKQIYMLIIGKHLILEIIKLSTKYIKIIYIAKIHSNHLVSLIITLYIYLNNLDHIFLLFHLSDTY